MFQAFSGGNEGIIAELFEVLFLCRSESGSFVRARAFYVAAVKDLPETLESIRRTTARQATLAQCSDCREAA
jgi:hypothetical protein